jgi:hypothetical protein
MKLLKALSLLGLGLGTIVFSTQGCSSDDTSTAAPASVGKVPPSPEGSATTSSDERTFALNALYLGESDRSGNKNKDAWKDYGYNLDGLITVVNDPKAADLAKVCNRAQGAPATVHNDGNEGIDNAFGKEILKLLDPFAPTPSKSLTDAIVKGDFTIMLKIKGLTDDPQQTNTGLSGTLLVGGAFSEDGKTTPTFSPSDDWPFRADPQVPISGAYINKGVFVNGSGGATVKLSLSIQGQSLDLTINKALITFKHNPSSGELTDGTIAGVLSTEEFVNGISSVAGRFSTDLCSGSTVEGIKDSIRQASDMLADGSQQPGVGCTGISVGIGFTAKRVANPTKEAPEGTVPPDPCAAPPADAGTDSGNQQQQDAGQDAGTDGGQ